MLILLCGMNDCFKIGCPLRFCREFTNFALEFMHKKSEFTNFVLEFIHKKSEFTTNRRISLKGFNILE
jgi:hypothetical protein